jgi:hypothetical protein
VLTVPKLVYLTENAETRTKQCIARVSYKRRRQAQKEYPGNIKHPKESNHWLHPTSTSNRYTAVLDEENGHQQQQDGPGNTPKHPPMYVSNGTTVSPPI